MESFLSQPEVWKSVQNNHMSKSDMMNDLCDSEYIKSYPIFRHNPNALQTILNTDDIEVVNPIGSYTKNTS